MGMRSLLATIATSGAASRRTIAYRAFTSTPALLAMGGTALGLGAAAYGGGAALSEARRASTQWRQGIEAAQMTRILSTMQTGPFGDMTKRYGMRANYGGSAGMTLASHYARNGTGIRDPFFSLVGGNVGRFLGG